MPAAGPRITIEFPQGHGLKAGDAIRHRSIDVGTVQDARLRSGLSGFQVTVELDPEAEILCREVSRFWVVRSHVALTEIQGLEAVVGVRYIGVSLGAPDAAEQRTFGGLVAAPADEFACDGLEFVLQADTRNGLNSGAPVTWRAGWTGVVRGTVTGCKTCGHRGSDRYAISSTREIKFKVLGDQCVWSAHRIVWNRSERGFTGQSGTRRCFFCHTSV